jgi:ornithine cyclodeaminase
MTRIISLEDIKHALEGLDPIPAQEEGFAAYSRGNSVIPPVGELFFDDPPGEVHIKYGYIKGDDYYVIKIASGFYENLKLGLPNGNGLMLLFSQKTGEILAVLLDEGYLTDVRTAAAGAVAARCLAPRDISGVGILGAGVQGRMQLTQLKAVTPCRKAWVWGLHQGELDTFREDMEAEGFSVETTLETAEVAAHCNLLVTATPAKAPLLRAEDIRAGTHITAMGSDTSEKNELDPGILERADLVVVDSRSQCRSRGEVFQALQAGCIDMGRIRELGEIIVRPELGRASQEQVTVADLTGVAVQDVQIAKSVYLRLIEAGQE